MRGNAWMLFFVAATTWAVACSMPDPGWDDPRPSATSTGTTLTSVTASSSGGASSTTSATSASSGGAPDASTVTSVSAVVSSSSTVAPCDLPNKICGGVCVPPAPDNGCDDPNCTACPGSGAMSGHVACVNNKCDCQPGFADCDSNPSTGCETATTDVGHCNGCGACDSPANATVSCEASGCAYACAANFCAPSGAPALGCSCNMSPPNGAATCAGGGCQLTSCTFGYNDCDGMPENGCESFAATDNNNCGVCGHVCSSGKHCAGICVSN